MMEKTQAFIEGQAAYIRGIEVADNPYPEDTNEYWDWQDGWLARLDDCQEEF